MLQCSKSANLLCGLCKPYTCTWMVESSLWRLTISCWRYLQQMVNKNNRLTKWALIVQQYEMDTRCEPGRANGNADAVKAADALKTSSHGSKMCYYFD